MTTVVLRRADAADAAFLRALYVETHEALLAALPAAAADQLIDLQLRAQTLQYHRTCPSAEDWVLLAEGTPAGRLWVDRGAAALRVLDLAVVRRCRRAGLATAVLQSLQEEADRAGLPVRLSVWHADQAAQALYASLGFRPVCQTGGHLELTRSGTVGRGAA